MTTDLYGRWIDLLKSETVGLREVDPDHNFRRAYGSDENGRPRFVIFSSEKPSLPAVSDAIEQVIGLRTDQTWATTLTLRDARMTEIFLHLAVDLVRRTRRATDSIDGMREIARAIDDWRKLLTKTPIRRPSDDVLRGLVAEAWFARHLVRRGDPADKVMRAWQGPFGHPQDFSFPGRAHEIKSVRPTSSGIRISSAAQLTSPAPRLLLEVVTLVESDEVVDETFTLPELAADLARVVVDAGAPRSLAAAPMSQLGIDFDDAYYESRRFSVVDHQTFDVVAPFPRITLDDLQPGLSQVTYSIERAAIRPFELKTSLMSELPGVVLDVEP